MYEFLFPNEDANIKYNVTDYPSKVTRFTFVKSGLL
jgi:hypothetical protein